MSRSTAPRQTFKQGDPEMPAEFRELLVKLLHDEQLEDNDNPA